MRIVKSFWRFFLTYPVFFDFFACYRRYLAEMLQSGGRGVRRASPVRMPAATSPEMARYGLRDHRRHVGFHCFASYPRRGIETTDGGRSTDEGDQRQTESRRYDRAGRPVTLSGFILQVACYRDARTRLCSFALSEMFLYTFITYSDGLYRMSVVNPVANPFSLG